MHSCLSLSLPLVPIPLFFAGPISSLSTSLSCTLMHILLDCSPFPPGTQGDPGLGAMHHPTVLLTVKFQTSGAPSESIWAGVLRAGSPRVGFGRMCRSFLRWEVAKEPTYAKAGR